MRKAFGLRYYLYILMPLAFISFTDWSYIFISKRWEIIPYTLLPEIVFYLVPLLFLMVFFRVKLGALLKSANPKRSSQKLLVRMPIIITAVIFFTGMANNIYNFYIVTVVDPSPLPTYPWHIFLSSTCGYVILPSFLAWTFSDFWATSFKIQLQKERDFILPPGKAWIWVQIVLVNLFVIVVPFINFVVDVSAWMRKPALFQSIFYTDILALSLAIVLAIVIFTKKITQPITFLEKAMNKVVRDGDLNLSVPVLDNAETGRLTVRFNRMIEGLRERELLQNTFGRYLTPELAKEVLSRGGIIKPENRVVTILFTDIENYTALSEKMPPSEVVAILNAYFSGIIAIINQHKGVVNKFIGDAVMAIFNAPVEDGDHGYNAVLAGLAIDRFSRESEFNGKRLHTRIGINTGNVIAGNIGSEDRVEYTVIGDSVNVAQRLEAHNKALGTSLLVGELTKELCTNRISFISQGEISVKGRVELLKVFTPVS